MDIRELTSHQIKEITKLLEKKESLASEIEEIDRKLAAYEQGRAPTVAKKASRKGRPRAIASGETAAKKAGPKRSAKRARRGQMKEGILRELEKAGKQGLTVKELASRLNANVTNVHAWFFTTGKKEKSIKKIGTGKYQLVK